MLRILTCNTPGLSWAGDCKGGLIGLDVTPSQDALADAAADRCVAQPGRWGNEVLQMPGVPFPYDAMNVAVLTTAQRYWLQAKKLSMPGLFGTLCQDFSVPFAGAFYEQFSG